MIVTEQMQQRVVNDWSRIAGEPVAVDVLGGCLYGFASEIACLRLAYQFRLMKAGTYRAGYSTNRASWFFRLDISGFGEAPEPGQNAA